jgi:hypothetical protein
MGLEPSGAVTLLIKHVDVLGNESATPAAIVTDLGDLAVRFAADRRNFKNLGFPGLVANASVEPATGDLIADADASGLFYTDDALLRYSLDDDTLFFAQTFLGLSYQTDVVFSSPTSGSRLMLDQNVTGSGARVQYRIGLAFYSGGDADPFYGDDAALFYPPNVFPWTDWLSPIVDPPELLDFLVTSQPGVTRGRIAAFEPILDAEQIVESLGDVPISASGGTRLPILNTYNAIAAVNITLQGGTSARRVEVMDKDKDLGPLVRAYDASNALVAATVDAAIFGY